MVQIYALCVGYLELDRASMLSDLAPGIPWTVPVSSYLVVHPQGRLLFDTGVHCQSITDPIGHMGEERARRIRIRSQVGADACYTRENLDRDVLPRVPWNAATMSHSLATLRHLRDRQGATLFYGHDPDQWQGMRRVPAPLIET
jgi:hypothetical protein